MGRRRWNRRPRRHLSYPSALPRPPFSLCRDSGGGVILAGDQSWVINTVQLLVDSSPHNSRLPERQARAATTSGPQRSPPNSSNSKWDPSIPNSMTSSYPSISFLDPNFLQDPCQLSSTAPLRSRPHHRDNEARNQGHDHQGHEQPPRPPASTAIFDSCLRTKTRVVALLGSLTTNLFLPFVNGIW